MLTRLSNDHSNISSTEPIRILGWVKTTLLDYPGKIASTLFLEGCNFRCPYCHNPELVSTRSRAGLTPLDLDEIFSYLATYCNMVEGVCITGGEPLLQPGLPGLCRKLRSQGLKIKLDTNGSLPERLYPLLEASLLDYIAVDIKGPPLKIHAVACTAEQKDDPVDAIESTVALCKESGIPYELRTTVVPGLLDEDDFHEVGKWMQGVPKFVLQQFRPGKTLDPLFQDRQTYPPQYLQELAHSLSDYFPECTVRGIG